MKRYHIDTQTPLNPPMADAVYHAQLCSDGHYRQCVDVHEVNSQRFEQWADRTQAVLRYSVT